MLRYILCVALRCSFIACRAALCAAGNDRNGHCAPRRAQQTTNHEPVMCRLPHGAICCVTSCVLRCAAPVRHAARHCGALRPSENKTHNNTARYACLAVLSLRPPVLLPFWCVWFDFLFLCSSSLPIVMILCPESVYDQCIRTLLVHTRTP